MAKESSSLNQHHRDELPAATDEVELETEIMGTETPMEDVHPFVMAENRRAKVLACFGGQGNAGLSELRFALRKPHLRTFLNDAFQVLRANTENEWFVKRGGFELEAWLLQEEEGMKNADFLASSPVSYPLIFLSQFVAYLDTLEQLNTNHGHVVANRWLSGATGHSQGIVTALLLAISRDEEELKKHALLMLQYVLIQGMESQSTLNFELENAKHERSPMLSVRGLRRDQLERVMESTKKSLQTLLEMQREYSVLDVDDDDNIQRKVEMHISLRNRETEFVVSGHPKALAALQDAIKKMSADPGDAQARVPFSKRKPSTKTMFLQTTCPFHCKMNTEIVARVLQRVEMEVPDLAIILRETEFAFPVYSTLDGEDLSCNKASLLMLLIKLQAVEPNDLIHTLKQCEPDNFTHVLTFGPGTAIARMVNDIIIGNGILVVDASFPNTPYQLEKASESSEAEEEEEDPVVVNVTPNTKNLVDLKTILSDQGTIRMGRHWGREFSPRLIKRGCDGTVFVETRFTQFLGKPPIMMSGMTPTTSFLGIDLVAACCNAGFQGELAAGGLAIPDHFRMKLEELTSKLKPGVGISINMLYLNAYQWGFQFPLVLEYAKAGYPIESITIGAGVPTPEKAEEIFDGLRDAGIKMIAFKPGSVQAILDVVELAKLHPYMTIMLQWTSGRGGGHHSFEDFHQPLLATYGKIRERDNIILVVGSGFGDAEGSFQYLNGTWSQKPPYLRKALMPVDGILVGSRCMVAKEAATALAVKQLIVNSPGIENELDWDRSYEQDTGGIITVQSELGEPIHKIHTRGMRLWKKYDQKYFALAQGEEREKAILKDKDAIIQELNDDFQKVFFGKNRDGKPVDLQEMTYAELLERMVELMYIVDGGDDGAGRLAPNRWIDVTYQSRVFKMMIRTEQRFLATQSIEEGSSLTADDVGKLDDQPSHFLAEFVKRYPECEDTLLADDDVSFFIDLCKDLRNGKPVNFVPVIDGDLYYWLKKDSLWCSEQLDAIPGRDAGRVCILHGPVAARFSKRIDEPIAEILGNIHNGYISYLGGKDSDTDIPTVQLVSIVPNQQETWDAVAMKTEQLVLGKKWFANPILKLVQSQLYEVIHETTKKVKFVEKQSRIVRAVLEYANSDQITLRVYDNEFDAELIHELTYHPELPNAPLHQHEQFLDEIKRMYRKIWDCDTHVSIHDTFTDSIVLSEKDVQMFNAAISYNGHGNFAPIDIATMAGWRPLVRPLFANELHGNLLKLVHLSHGYKMLSEERTLVAPGERIDSQAKVVSVLIQPNGNGKKIRVEGTLYRHDPKEKVSYPWIGLHSEFLIRGTFEDYESTFLDGTYNATVKCTDDVMVSVLCSKPWLKLGEHVEIHIGDEIEFRMHSVKERYTADMCVTDIEVHGSVFKRRRKLANDSPISVDSDGFVELTRGGKADLIEIGKVSFISNDAFKTNPVTIYLDRIRVPPNAGTVFESGGYELLKFPVTVNAPGDSTPYAEASHDLNPIHRSRTLSILADLPNNGSTIVHGMWTAAMARGILEKGAANGKPGDIASYQVEFVGMVFPNDELCVTLQHVGVLAGRKVVHVLVHKRKSSELVMKGRAEIEQPKTAYLFTGQGSANVGMGMDRYEENERVKKVWDIADKHLKSLYGFSILQIVRENPTSLTIHFGGAQGKRIRDNYRQIKTENPSTGVMEPLIKEIHANTKSFTFKSPSGLLYATQFSQPALVLVQKAAFEELVEGGFVPDDAIFAGHSLGEYAALASFADVLSIEALVETVFLRGMVMQNAVPRDQAGRSDYAMVAANPSRVSKAFTPEDLERVVQAIGDSTIIGQPLIQTVNLNVRGSQYVIAGELVALDALSEVLGRLANGQSAIDVALITESCDKALRNKRACQESGIPYTLRRGIATIPLPGIDVPFHSRKLLSGVPAFRQLLEPRLELDTVSCVIGRLVGKYIPNVNAEPFSLEPEYIRRIYELTGSKALLNLLGRESTVSDAEKARTLLIELLAHQFAMPVQWIKTQDVMFHSRVQRVIEMGPAATLATMAKRTLKLGIFGDRDEYDPEILWWKQDSDSVFYQLENYGPSFTDFIQVSGDEEQEDEKQEQPVKQPAGAPPMQPTAMAQPPPATRIGGGGRVEDAQVTAKHALRVLLALKFKKQVSDITDKTTVKQLSSGKSAVQNEVVGDISAEFGQTPEGGADMPIVDLGSKLAGTYTKLGKVTTKAINKMLGNALPGGFSPSDAKQYLANDCGLGPGHTDSVLLHALSMQPSNRLGSPVEAKQWLDQCRDAFAADAGISLKQGGGDSSSFDQTMMMMMMMGGAGAGAVAPIEDAPVSAKHALSVILALKFNKALSDIKDGDSIKQLSSGKSAVQNEVVGDMSAEFGQVPEGGADLTIGALGAKLGATYSKLGKVTSKAIGKMFAASLPGGFGGSAVKEYLSRDRNLPEGRVDSVLLHALAMQPKQRLAGQSEAKQWLDQVCDSYGSYAGIVIPRPGQQQSQPHGMNPMMMMMQQPQQQEMDSALMRKLHAMLEGQVELFTEFVGDETISKLRSSLESEAALRKDVERSLNDLKRELGDSFCESIQPQHDPKRVRSYDSFWNWVIQDALDMHLHVLKAIQGDSLGKDNEHYVAMAEWISNSSKGLAPKQPPPQAWFRNYLCNRATPELLEAVKHFSRNMYTAGHVEYAQIITLLAEQVRTWLHRVPVHVALFQSQAPCVTIGESNGEIIYDEKPRGNVQNAVEYVEEMSRGLYFSRGSRNEVHDPMQSLDLPTDATLDVEDESPIHSEDEEEYDDNEDNKDERVGTRKQEDNGKVGAGRKPRSEAELQRHLSLAVTASKTSPSDESQSLPQGPVLDSMRATVVPKDQHRIVAELDDNESPRNLLKLSSGPSPDDYTSIHVTKSVPYIHLKSPSSVDKTVRIINERLSSKFLSALHDIATNGVSFAGQVALVTGAGAGSIGEEMVKALLEGGATVVVTVRTSRSEEQMTKEYERFRSIYEEFGAKGSRCILEPTNCASAQDMTNLVRHVYEELDLDIDFVVPFAAAAERGRDISNIDSFSEMSHRMMLTNLVRLLGEIKKAKETREIHTRPAMVLLPCSPNHGEFGNDGLYAESKLGCESLVNKWASEGWGDYLCLAAAVIGWTRSKLMTQNNIVAPGIEALGCRTFSTTEMAFNLISLFHPRMITLAAEEPIWADLTGNWIALDNMNEASRNIRKELSDKSRLVKAKTQSKELNPIPRNPQSPAIGLIPPVKRERLANPKRMCQAFPTLPTNEQHAELSKKLLKMVDLRQVVVVCGFGEVGPWGNAKTRWEMECFGEFSLEGSIELAWIVGLIKHHDGPLPSNPRQRYIGWVDRQTNEPVADQDIKRRYEPTLLKHCGIRLIEPELFEGYDPSKKSMLHTVAIEKDLPPLEVESFEDAVLYRDEIGADKVEVYQRQGDGQWMVRIKKGATISVPKALRFDRKVAGQLPTGWDAKRFGVPPEIAESVDPVSLYGIVSTMEALVNSGITDTYEFYQYCHVAEVGSSLGSGMGGMRSLKRMFFDRKFEQDIPSDTLAESFINTMPAWINMLLFSSSGPIKTPVNACATAAVSVDIAVETIKSGKARVMVAGGLDDFGETGSYEFAQMGATLNSELDKSMGRTPRESSRPTSESRNGFVEGQGGAVQLLMDADLALQMGCPIYAIIALTNTATDKQGRSIPAPGRGILTTAREETRPEGEEENPLLDIEFRKENLLMELEMVDKWEQSQGNRNPDMVRKLAARKRKAVYDTWGQNFYESDPTISSIRGSLSVWGLTVDDLAVASFHGTSTKLNDKNESQVVNKQMKHLGRTRGNILSVISQKWLTAHAKGAAAGYMMNGLIQSMLSKTVPGNRNLDNVSPELRKFEYLFYPNRSLCLPTVKATFLKSFGFGQAGAEIVLVHPDFLFGTISTEAFSVYQTKRDERERIAFRFMQGVFTGKNPLVQIKDAPPYTSEQEEKVYLDPHARASYDSSKKTWTFGSGSSSKPMRKEAPSSNSTGIVVEEKQNQQKMLHIPAQTRLKVTLEENAQQLRNDDSDRGIGVDVEEIQYFENLEDRMVFIERNFTVNERRECQSGANPASSFAGKWAAKEAVVKAITSTSSQTRSLWPDASAPLVDIEILRSSSGAPMVTLHGHAKQVFDTLSLSQIKVSISHSAGVAVAHAIAS